MYVWHVGVYQPSPCDPAGGSAARARFFGSFALQYSLLKKEESLTKKQRENVWFDLEPLSPH